MRMNKIYISGDIDMVQDGHVFYDKDEKIIFNQYSFCELVKWDIVKFADIPYEQASRLVINSSLVKKG